MLFLNIVLLVIFFTGLLLCRARTGEEPLALDKKEHKLYYLYPLADCLLKVTGFYKVLNKKETVRNSIQALYLTNKPEVQLKLYWCNKVSLIIMIIILFDLLSIISQITAQNNVLTEGRYLQRPETGEGNTQVELKVTMDNKEESVNQNGEQATITRDLRINVAERSYRPEEIDLLFKEGKEYISVAVLGNNQSEDLITEKLNLVRTIPGTSITIEWEPSDKKLIESNGSINNETLTPEGTKTAVTARMSYLDYKSEYTMTFYIFPKPVSEEEVLLMELENEINASSERSLLEDRLELPETLENYNLRWEGKENSSGIILLFFGAIIAILVWMNGEKQLDQQMKRRKNQMLLDYPEIINKFTLLVNAGMTVKQAWSRMAEDYSIKLSIRYDNKRYDNQRNNNKRYAYEEMLTTVRELKLGVPESTAYEQFGRRIGLISYIKFSSLVSQNLKKGNKGFTDLLMQIAEEAFEDRKEAVKRLGEEAGAKLIIPMMIMLIIVFMIILIPAFMSF